MKYRDAGILRLDYAAAELLIKAPVALKRAFKASVQIIVVGTNRADIVCV